MLVIALIRFHYIGIDKVRFRIFNRHADADKLRLFFEDIPLEEYFDKIALNYHDKLPLIFGKWSLLKKELGKNYHEPVCGFLNAFSLQIINHTSYI